MTVKLNRKVIRLTIDSSGPLALARELLCEPAAKRSSIDVAISG